MSGFTLNQSDVDEMNYSTSAHSDLAIVGGTQSKFDDTCASEIDLHSDIDAEKNLVNHQLHSSDALNDDDEDADLAESELDHFDWNRVRGLIWVALKQNAIPALILNSFAVLILVLYYTNEPVYNALSYLGGLKTKYGILYSFVITSIFGGLIPYCFILASGPPSVRTPYWIITRFFWFGILWGLRGIELDYLYRFQALMFGDDQKVSTIAFKTMFDEFVYSVIWVAWFLTFISKLEMNDFRLRYTIRRTVASRRWWINEVVVTNVAAWIVWIPACIAIYALSMNLQTTLLNIVLVFWVLLVRIISATKPKEDQPVGCDIELPTYNSLPEQPHSTQVVEEKQSDSESDPTETEYEDNFDTESPRSSVLHDSQPAPFSITVC